MSFPADANSQLSSLQSVTNRITFDGNWKLLAIFPHATKGRGNESPNADIAQSAWNRTGPNLAALFGSRRNLFTRDHGLRISFFRDGDLGLGWITIADSDFKSPEMVFFVRSKSKIQVDF